VLIFLFIIALAIAIKCEIADQHNAYSAGKPNDKKNIKTCLRKLKICLEGNTKTIRWRRIMITVVISLFLIYMFVFTRWPEPNELWPMFIILYIVFYASWDNYMNVTGNEIVKFGTQHINTINSLITQLKKQKYFFI